MRTCVSIGLAALVVALAICLGRPSIAGAAPQVPARLIWDGDVCGDAKGFSTRVMRRTSAVRFVQSGERVTVRLSIERGATGLDARVRIEGRGRVPIARHIDSPDCDDALDALALVVAISVEGRSGAPSARPRRRTPPRRPAPEAPPPEAPPPEAPPLEAPPAEPAPVPTSPAPEPAPPEPAPPPDPAVLTPPESSEPPKPPPPPPASPVAPPPSPPPAALASSSVPPSELELGAGLAAQMAFGIAPDPLFGASVWISANWNRHDLWSPRLVLSATHARRDGMVDARGDVDFEMSAANLALCPLRIGTDVIQVRPCALGSLGRVASEGHSTFLPRAATRPWGDVGGGLEVLARFGILELRAVAGAAVPLVRDRFRFGPECAGAACELNVFHRVAPVIWSGAVGAGLSVW